MMDRRAFLASLLASSTSVAGEYNMFPADYGGMFADSSSPSLATTSQHPTVTVFTQENCGPCDRLKKNLEPLEGVNIVWERDAPEWVPAFPTIYWEHRDGWRYIAGAVTLEDFKERVVGTLRGMGYVIQMQVIPEGDWTYPPPMFDHLQCSIHQFAAEELRGHTARELVLIHNYEHEHGNPRASFGKQVASRAAASCPTFT